MSQPAVRDIEGWGLAIRTGNEAVQVVAASAADAGSIEVARAFGVRSVASWWSQLVADMASPQPLRPLLEHFPYARLPGPIAASADCFGATIARMAPELAAYAIGRAYTEMLPQDYRSRFGVYYTPPALTERLIAQATAAGTSWETARILDPACGGGAFLAPVAQRIIEALPGCSPQILLRNIAARLRGYEIDPFAAWLSQVTLDAVLLPISRLVGRAIPPVVTICDTLNDLPVREQFELVIGNPPYGRVRLDAGQRRHFERSLYGHANLYGMFTEVALWHTAENGVIAYVTPTSFLAGQYFKNLRSLLAEEAPPASIDFITLRKGVFDSVLQETLLAVYVKCGLTKPVRVHVLTPAGASLHAAEAGQFDLPENNSQPWLLPRDPGVARFVTRLVGMPCRLGDWGYEVSTGPLVWNRHKDQLADSPGEGRAPLIWAESITSDGRFEYRATKKNHRPYFQLRPGDGWLVIDRPCILAQRTTAKEQARRLIAAYLPPAFLARHGGRAVIENHLNMIRPRRGVSPAVAPDVLVAFLNSGAADRAFRCVSGSVAVSAYELESLPLPEPAALARLTSLVKSSASRGDIENECRRLYGDGDEFPAALRQPNANFPTPAAHIS